MVADRLRRLLTIVALNRGLVHSCKANIRGSEKACYHLPERLTRYRERQ